MHVYKAVAPDGAYTFQNIEWLIFDYLPALAGQFFGIFHGPTAMLFEILIAYCSTSCISLAGFVDIFHGVINIFFRGI